jgi:ketosteroid isomerase-like protein
MSRENVELYRQGIDALNHQDLDGVIAVLDPAVEWIARLAGVEGRVNGHDGVRSWWKDQYEAFETIQIDLQEVVDDGDWVVASGTSHVQGGESGVPLEVPLAQATRWRNGKCIYLESFRTVHEALEAAGLSDSDS